MAADERALWPIAGTEPPGRAITAREKVAAGLRDRVLTGSAKDGERLDLDLIAAEFGTSRTPVREACIDLARDGLVEITPRSSVRVCGLTPEAVEENFAIITSLSAIVAEWAAQRITPDELRRAGELAVEVAIAVRHGRDAGPAIWMFHDVINRACKSPRLLAMLGAAGRLIPQSFLEVMPSHAADSLTEHDELLAALARHDAHAAAEVTRAHMSAAADIVSRRAAELRSATC